MAKKSVIAREHKRAKLTKRFEKARDKLRKLAKSIQVSYEERIAAQESLQKLSTNGSAVRQCRRCQLCGRPRGVFRKFGLCRLCLRVAFNRGDVPGVRKASW